MKLQNIISSILLKRYFSQYIKRMLSRDEVLKSNWGTICTLVEMEAGYDKKQKIQAADTVGILRII